MTHDNAASRPVDDVAERFVDDYAALNPVEATYMGLPGHEDRLTDLSPDGYAARADLTRRALAAATAARPSDEREQVARDAFLERLGLDVELDDAHVPQSQVSVLTSGLHDVRSVFDLMPTDGEDAWSNIDARLAAVPQALEGYRETLTRAAEQGHVSAKRQLGAVAAQVRSWTGQEGGGSFFGDLVARSDVEALRGSLEKHATEANDAFADFGRWLETDLAPRGRDKEAVGREQYTLGSRYFLGATVDLEETYAWGWEELARIEADMNATADRIVPGASIAEAVAGLDADPARDLGSREAFQAWMQGLSDRIVSEFDGVHFDIAEPIRTLACKVAPINDGGAWYTPPTEDWVRPGTMWFSFTDDHRIYSTWRETTTVFHEGVPGHHLQCAQSVHRADLLNRWQRLMCWVSGHGEGWALYAERLMDELGFFADAGDRLGFLDMQGFRAARVIVDIGVHCGPTIPPNPWGWRVGETWTADLVLEFMLAHSRMDPGSVRFEVNRYLGWPGQAPSYKVGEKIWLEARDAARVRKGPAFDLKAFHTAALDLGSLGLDPLQEALARL